MKRLISFVVFIFIAVIGWWSVLHHFDEEQTKRASGSRYVDVFMNEFTLTAMDANGQPDYTLEGTHLQKYNDSDETEIKKPIIQFMQPQGQWKVSADSAIINNKKETIWLNKNVTMQQQNIEPALTFHTQSLLIDTKTQIAQTDAPVEISQGISNITADGMVFNNLTHELELPANVNGYYLPVFSD